MNKTDYIYNVKIVNVVDGDTVDLDIDLGFYTHSLQRVRLAGVDTAELTSPDEDKRKLAKDAKSYMMQYLNKSGTIKSYKQDKFGRFLVDITVDGVHLNQILIQSGLAVVYDGGKRV